MKRARHVARELALYLLFGSLTLAGIALLAGLVLMPLLFREGPAR